ncbi:MAG: tRNA pseudouridine(38-40) synthase TruA [Acidobacteria bacterium]|nr:tRNA pseudouridine(38-40) synthase TruA [Acidobacteriota bacterium]
MSEIVAEEISREHSGKNVLLRLAYDGTDFSGWQIQLGLPSIQGQLTEAFQKITGELVQVRGSGRTDAGVHALGQAASVRLQSPIPAANLVRALNHHLPGSIRVLSSVEVANDFHAQLDAVAKTYRYRIYRASVCSPWLVRFVDPYPYPLDEKLMIEAAGHFAGTHDFRSLASVDKSGLRPNRTFVRTIFESRMERLGEELVYTVRGSGFLTHMVRNIVGLLIEMGHHRRQVHEIAEIIAARDRRRAGPTAPARGLHLVHVEYRDEIGEFRLK